MTTAQDASARGIRLPRQARRKQLLGAAREIFVAQGFHAAAMDDIAERAGVSKPVLYQHFPSKLDLYLALLDQHAAELKANLKAALASTTDNKVRVERCIAAYFDFMSREGGAFRLVFESDLLNEASVAQRVDHALDSAVAAIADIIATDTGAGPNEAQLLAAGLAGLSEVSARWWLANQGAIDKDRAVALLAALAWRGISGFPRAHESANDDEASGSDPAEPETNVSRSA